MDVDGTSDDAQMAGASAFNNGALKRARPEAESSPESPVSLSNEPAEERKRASKPEEAPGAAATGSTKKVKKVDVVVVPGPHSVAAAKNVKPNDFDPENHYYPRVINAQIHPMVSWFMSLGNERIAIRYCHVHPRVNSTVLRKMLAYKPKYFRWAGSDLFCVATPSGDRRMIIIETNSCPSGQKSMPFMSEDDTNESPGYKSLLQGTFLEWVRECKDLPEGELAVVYDKNEMEATGYAAELATLVQNKVYLVEFYEDDPDPPVRWHDGVMMVRTTEKEWKPIKACFRYVTQRPWTRFPIHTKTLVLNPVLSCLAGGRNKMVAAKAYELFNSENVGTGLEIRVPETIKDVNKNELRLWVNYFGGHAVIKIPYSNAGQGVYTITSEAELDNFLSQDHPYDKYIVQSLVGNARWTSVTRAGQFFHIGTVPNKKGETFVADLRVMVGAGADGYKPICMYARRAPNPLVEELTAGVDSWAMLGTNLSEKKKDGSWTTDQKRLICMDRKDFNRLGLGLDDLIDAYVQTVLASVAIDRMCCRLVDPKTGVFNLGLFSSLNEDKKLLQELLATPS